MKILNRYPYFTHTVTVTAGGQSVRVKPYQVVVWVSITLPDLGSCDLHTPRLPAVLDTANNYNFSITRSQLARWAGLQPEHLESRGRIRLLAERIPVHEAKVWLHPNMPGKMEPSGRAPHPLVLEDGIALLPDAAEARYRLPLLGLRALTDNQLRTLIDGERREVTVWTPRKWWWPW